MNKGVFLGSQTQTFSDLELRIKEVADEVGVKMKELADMVGVSPSYISRVNSGGVTPNVKLVQKIAEALNVPVHRLIVAPKGYGHFYVNNQWEGIRKR